MNTSIFNMLRVTPFQQNTDCVKVSDMVHFTVFSLRFWYGDLRKSKLPNSMLHVNINLGSLYFEYQYGLLKPIH